MHCAVGGLVSPETFNCHSLSRGSSYAAVDDEKKTKQSKQHMKQTKRVRNRQAGIHPADTVMPLSSLVVQHQAIAITRKYQSTIVFQNSHTLMHTAALQYELSREDTTTVAH